MDRKIIMGVAAVAGIGLLLYMRKKGDAATLGTSGALVGSGSGFSNWASSPIVITNSKAPVLDTTAKAPVTTAQPETNTKTPVTTSSGGGGAVWGASGATAGFSGIKDGRRTYADGSSSALTESEMDLYNRGILGGPYVGTHNAGASAPAPAPAAGGTGGGVWGARG
jgi:hypothetical protein